MFRISIGTVRNPGYVHELAAIFVEQDDPKIRLVAERNGVTDAELSAAVASLRPLTQTQRQRRVHELYVADAREQGYAVGDPAQESTWVLAQRADAHYS